MKTILALSIFFLSHSSGYAGCIESFDELLSQIEMNDGVLADNTQNTFYIEELVHNSNGKLIEKRKIDKVPDKYEYEGRIIPNKTQQRDLGISLFVRRVLLKNVRVVTEKTSGGEELSSYWFKREKGCWKLSFKSVNLRK